MLDLTENYINTLKLKNTLTLVVLDGVYQSGLSDSLPDNSLKNQGLTITRNTQIDNPLHLLFLNSKEANFKFEIIAEEGSNATLIEEHKMLDGGASNGSVELGFELERSSKLVHYRLQLIDDKDYDLRLRTTIKQEGQSSFESHFISKGAKKYQDQIDVQLLGSEACYDIKGISLLNDNQTMGQSMLIEHLAPNCRSNVLAKVIVDDNAINNFDCRVLVSAKIAKTEAHVNNRNILLSEQAAANSSPELEVYTDDVICTHGSTVGQLDQDAIFYLRSRGIVKDDAEKILITGFVQEIMKDFSQYPRVMNAAGVSYE